MTDPIEVEMATVKQEVKNNSENIGKLEDTNKKWESEHAAHYEATKNHAVMMEGISKTLESINKSQVDIAPTLKEMKESMIRLNLELVQKATKDELEAKTSFRARYGPVALIVSIVGGLLTIAYNLRAG